MKENGCCVVHLAPCSILSTSVFEEAQEEKGGVVCVRKAKCRSGAEEVFFGSHPDQYDCGAAGVSGTVYFVSAAHAFGGQLFGGRACYLCRVSAGAESGAIPDSI